MPADSSATKARILQAAFREFAAYGLAGARIDRIAATAPANKRAIYAYFGNKEALFDIVLADQLTLGADAVPTDRAELGAYAAELMEFYAADPDRARLAAWRQLERPLADPAQVATYRDTLHEHRRQQPATEPLEPWDLLAIVMAIAGSWAHADSAVRELIPDLARRGRPTADRRAAVIESVRRIVEASASSLDSDQMTHHQAARKTEPPVPAMDSLF
jgi:AcrR family transcriptional regulator